MFLKNLNALDADTHGGRSKLRSDLGRQIMSGNQPRATDRTTLEYDPVMSSASARPPGGTRASAWSRDSIEQQIYLIRGHKVMLDADLAGLYGVETRALVQAVKRNRSRFPSDFVLGLTTAESEQLRSL